MGNVLVTDVSRLSLEEKIAIGLERISEVHRSLLWEKGKNFKLTPIQIQTIIFLAKHSKEICNISYIAKEFNITKPTLSDSVKLLIKRKYVTKVVNPTDQRSFYLTLTEKGRKVYNDICNYDIVLVDILKDFPIEEKDTLLRFLLDFIHKLVQKKVIKVQRMCYTCKFFAVEKGKHFCKFLEAELNVSDFRLDCPDYIQKEIKE